jgi:hypothetical protein
MISTQIIINEIMVFGYNNGLLVILFFVGSYLYIQHKKMKLIKCVLNPHQFFFNILHILISLDKKEMFNS